ncbi:hypothetical protein KFU94_02575 [Chloroflexi bacterium TSY]|nr:hypothetical protein [Chloroflexi bacterium TSY]
MERSLFGVALTLRCHQSMAGNFSDMASSIAFQEKLFLSLMALQPVS